MLKVALFVLLLMHLSEGSALSTATAALAPGQWTVFTGPPAAIGKYGISWQAATAFWDSGHQEFQFMAKMQNGGAGSHWIYSEATDAWRATSEDVVPGMLGHIWERGFDLTRGDYYFHGMADDRLVRVMKRSVEAGAGVANNPWTTLSLSPVTSPTAAPEGGVEYHPNLFGPGDGGIVFARACARHAWRRQTDTWVTFPGHTYYGGGKWWGHTNAAGQYLPGYDRLVMGTGVEQGGYRPLVGYDAGSGGVLNPVNPIWLGNPPVRITGSTSGSLPWGKLVVHPGDDSCLMILEAGPPNRVWTNRNGGSGAGSDAGPDGWVLESYTHPFYSNLPLADGDAGSWTVGHVPGYGVLWGMAYSGVTSQSVLWKPPASSAAVSGTPAAIPGKAFSLCVSPNPFSSSVRITLPSAALLKVFDARGNIVAVFKGARELVWNARGAPAGIYLITAETPSGKLSKRVMLFR